MTHQLVYAARSDRGLIRSNNQDSVYAGSNLLVVADGMGGHAAGDMASRLVVAAFVPLDSRDAGGDLLRALAKATRDGNNAIAEVVHEKPELDGMGTTVTALLFDGGRLGMAHVGDSRAYLYRDGVLHQLTHDDTFVQSLIDDGRITQEEATHHPQRSLLLRALNGTEVDPSLTIREVTAGDRYLICSDGLPGVVSAEAIAEALANPDPAATADALIQLALVGGGPDNITVIVADVMDTGVGSGPTEARAAVDPDETGPIGSVASVRMTAEMPRVPLPADSGGRAGPRRVRPGRRGPSRRTTRLRFRPARFRALGTTGTAIQAAARRHHRRPRPGRAGGRCHRGIVPLGPQPVFRGVSNGQVAVFRGVDGSVLGLQLSSVQEGSCEPGLNGCMPLEVDDLVPSARAQVVAGIQAGTLDDARGVITRLTGQMLPPCPSPEPAPLPPGSTFSTAPSGTAGSPSSLPGSTAPSTAAGTAPGGSTPLGSPNGSTSGTIGAPRNSGATASSGARTSGAPASTATGLSGEIGSGLIPGAPGSGLASGTAATRATTGGSPTGSSAVSTPATSTPATPTPLNTTMASGTPLPTRAPEPGVTCRVVK